MTEVDGIRPLAMGLLIHIYSSGGIGGFADLGFGLPERPSHGDYAQPVELAPDQGLSATTPPSPPAWIGIQ